MRHLISEEALSGGMPAGAYVGEPSVMPGEAIQHTIMGTVVPAILASYEHEEKPVETKPIVGPRLFGFCFPDHLPVVSQQTILGLCETPEMWPEDHQYNADQRADYESLTMTMFDSHGRYINRERFPRFVRQPAT